MAAQTIPAADFKEMPTGASDAGCIESYAENPVYWVERRPHEVGQHWGDHGTWLRPPILIDRRFLDPLDTGLQVLEGRNAPASCEVACARGYTSRPTIRLGSDTLRQHQEPKTGRIRLTMPADDVGPRDWQITYLWRTHDSGDRAH